MTVGGDGTVPAVVKLQVMALVSGVPSDAAIVLSRRAVYSVDSASGAFGVRTAVRDIESYDTVAGTRLPLDERSVNDEAVIVLAFMPLENVACGAT